MNAKMNDASVLEGDHGQLPVAAVNVAGIDSS